MIRPIWFEAGRLYLIDQTRLPRERVILEIQSVAQMVEAISQLRVRGAPAIGIAGAYGCMLAAREAAGNTERIKELCMQLREARPTAVNLAWAVDRVTQAINIVSHGQWEPVATREARTIHQMEEAACEAMSNHGASLIREGGRYLTHCNAGPLATGGLGSALGVFLAAKMQGLNFEVLVDETRPLLQGARLTSLELIEAGIPCRLIADSMAAFAMKRLGVDGVFIGADRIAANGDTANKIGSYSLALAAREHGVPFHVVAPSSTIDTECPDGTAIPIEERPAEELLGFGETCWTPTGLHVWNPAFDVVPADWIETVITERGLLKAPLKAAIERIFA